MVKVPGLATCSNARAWPLSWIAVLFSSARGMSLVRICKVGSQQAAVLIEWPRRA